MSLLQFNNKKSQIALGQLLLLVAIITIFSLLIVNVGSFLMGNITINSDQPTGSEYNVIKVVDGDTIDVDMNGEKKRIRLIGINAPESVAPNQPIECFGKEASTYLHSLLTGKNIQLIADPSQSDQDKYGRLLRYVFLGNIDINQQLLKEGYAKEYTYNNKAYQYQQEFRQSEAQAKIAKVGLWQENICNN